MYGIFAYMYHIIFIANVGKYTQSHVSYGFRWVALPENMLFCPSSHRWKKHPPTVTWSDESMNQFVNLWISCLGLFEFPKHNLFAVYKISKKFREGSE